MDKKKLKGVLEIDQYLYGYVCIVMIFSLDMHICPMHRSLPPSFHSSIWWQGLLVHCHDSDGKRVR